MLALTWLTSASMVMGRLRFRSLTAAARPAAGLMMLPRLIPRPGICWFSSDFAWLSTKFSTLCSPCITACMEILATGSSASATVTESVLGFVMSDHLTATAAPFGTL